MVGYVDDHTGVGKTFSVQFSASGEVLESREASNEASVRLGRLFVICSNFFKMAL